MQSIADLMKVYFLLNILLLTTSAPLLTNNKWANMGLLMVAIPGLMGALPRGGETFGRLAVDGPFLMAATLIGMGVVAGISQINKRIETNFKDYGKTTRSTITVLGLRAFGLLIGFLISYFLFGKNMYKHFNTPSY